MDSRFAVIPSTPYPLGATPVDGGVNFAIFSSAAKAIDLCLYAPGKPKEEVARVRLSNRDGNIWHTAVSGIGPGWLYGFRAHGTYDPEQGQRFTPQKLLIDPYAKAVAGTPDWHPAMQLKSIAGADPRFQADNGEVALKSVIVDDGFDWQGDHPPKIPWRKTVIYEAHVKGLTKLRESVPEQLRGTYAGLAHESVTSYLKDLGVTAIQLLPVHQHKPQIS